MDLQKKRLNSLKNNRFWQYLFLLIKQWYVLITILLAVYSLTAILFQKPSWQIPFQIITIALILTVIYAGYKIWIKEKSEKENLLTKQEELTPEEKEILLCALKNSGRINLLSSTTIEKWVVVGGKEFLYEKDLNKTMTYVYAFKTLCEKGLVEHISTTRYELTALGFKEAKKL